MPTQTTIHRTEDFELTANASSPHWQAAPWLELKSLDSEPGYQSRAKLLWSAKGLYLLADFQDEKLTCTHSADNADLFTEDVVEIFLQPSVDHPIYFEYELSPLGFELPLLISNNRKTFHGWLAWKNEKNRATRRVVRVHGGSQSSGSSCTGWTAEMFLPFDLMRGLVGAPPAAGDVWRGNIYRIDYDRGTGHHYAWAAETGPRFHDYQNFGSMRFA